MRTTFAPVLGEATVQELREAIHGEVLRADDDGYAEACRVWNGAFDERRPALDRPRERRGGRDRRGRLRAQQRPPIAVRGGGHSIAGFSTVDDGIVIDLSAMRGVRVDPAARRAYVGGGAVWGDVDHETQAHGLATTGGLVSTTGVAGFTLGGGIGWLMRKHGLACDNLRRGRRGHGRRRARARERDRERRPALGPARRRRQLRRSSRSSSSRCSRSGRRSTRG